MRTQCPKVDAYGRQCVLERGHKHDGHILRYMVEDDSSLIGDDSSPNDAA